MKKITILLMFLFTLSIFSQNTFLKEILPIATNEIKENYTYIKTQLTPEWNSGYIEKYLTAFGNGLRYDANLESISSKNLIIENADKACGLYESAKSVTSFKAYGYDYSPEKTNEFSIELNSNGKAKIIDFRTNNSDETFNWGFISENGTPLWLFNYGNFEGSEEYYLMIYSQTNKSLKNKYKTGSWCVVRLVYDYVEYYPKENRSINYITYLKGEIFAESNTDKFGKF